ncbi:MAG: DUF1273 family protein [Clostridia bacterium]|nr:DUF1273 family protein [Clostridia bacterium]
MDGVACCFTGHRNLIWEDIPSIRENLNKTVETLIANGVNVFMTGGAKGFDEIAAEVISSFKDRYPQIYFWVVVPYSKKADDESLLKADRVEALSPGYYRGCMHVRNRFMVDHADYCISYLRKETGGTVYTVNYAKRRGVCVIHI